jgi:hypothetical protein
MREGGRAVRQDNGNRRAGCQGNIIGFAKRGTDHIPFSHAIDEDSSGATVDSTDKGKESAGMVVFGDGANEGDVATTIVLWAVGWCEWMETEFFAATTTEGLVVTCSRVGGNEWVRDGGIGGNVRHTNRGGGIRLGIDSCGG